MSKKHDKLIQPTTRTSNLECAMLEPEYILTDQAISKESLISIVTGSDIADKPLKDYLSFEIYDESDKQEDLEDIYRDICRGNGVANQYRSKMSFIRMMIDSADLASSAKLEMIIGYIPVMFTTAYTASLYDNFIESENRTLYITPLTNYGRYYLDKKLISINCSCHIMKANSNMIFTICTGNVNNDITARKATYKVLFAKKINDEDLDYLALLFETTGVKAIEHNDALHPEDIIKVDPLW